VCEHNYEAEVLGDNQWVKMINELFGIFPTLKNRSSLHVNVLEVPSVDTLSVV
jgi:hypothetical protein